MVAAFEYRVFFRIAEVEPHDQNSSNVESDKLRKVFRYGFLCVFFFWRTVPNALVNYPGKRCKGFVFETMSNQINWENFVGQDIKYIYILQIPGRRG